MEPLPGQELFLNRVRNGWVFQTVHWRTGQRSYEQVQKTKGFTIVEKIKNPLVQTMERPEKGHRVLDHATQVGQAKANIIKSQEHKEVIGIATDDEIKSIGMEEDKVGEKDKVTPSQAVIVTTQTGIELP